MGQNRLNTSLSAPASAGLRWTVDGLVKNQAASSQMSVRRSSTITPAAPSLGSGQAIESNGGSSFSEIGNRRSDVLNITKGRKNRSSRKIFKRPSVVTGRAFRGSRCARPLTLPGSCSKLEISPPSLVFRISRLIQ